MDQAIELLKGLFNEVLSAFVGILVGIGSTHLYTKLREKYRRRQLAAIFGKNSGKYYIVHSAIEDKERGAFDYPACDTTAARYIGSVFSKCGMSEDKHYYILPDTECLDRNGEPKDKIISENLICICSPKRNHLTKLVLEKSTYLRFHFDKDVSSGELVISDSKAPMMAYISSRDDSQHEETAGVVSGYDYALVASLPNPYNHERRVLVISGIHGTGTQGAAKYFTEIENREAISSRKEKDVAEVIFKVSYAGQYESITKVVML